MYPSPASFLKEWIRDSSASEWKHRGASNEDVPGSSPGGGATSELLSKFFLLERYPKKDSHDNDNRHENEDN